jgi:hypothetical protein
MATLMLLMFIAVIALPSVVWLYSLADVVRNEFHCFSSKVIWFVLLCSFPPLGTILYLLIGRYQRITSYPVGRLVVFFIFFLPALLVVAYTLFSLGHMTFIPEPPKAIQIQI